MVESIVDAASTLLVSFDATDITTTRIAEQAGCSVAAIYRFFPNREAVFAELGDRYRARLASLHAGLLAIPRGREPDLVAREAFDRVIGFVRSEPGFANLWWSGLIDTRTIGSDRRDGFVFVAERLQALYEPDADLSSGPSPDYLVLVEAADHLIGVAFRASADGDQAILDATRRLLTLHLRDITNGANSSSHAAS
jgi:AcrR family transcriptional regulator